MQTFLVILIGGVVLLYAGIAAWWWLVPERKRRRQERQRRERYAIPETRERVAIAERAGAKSPSPKGELPDLPPLPPTRAKDDAEIAERLPSYSPTSLLGRLVQTLDGEAILTAPPFTLRDGLMSKKGVKYYRSLVARVPAWIVVCPKVRLDSFIVPINPAGMNALDWATWRRRSRLRGVDFLICDARGFRPLLAIMFHRGTDKANRTTPGGGQDRIIDEVCMAIGLPMLRLTGSFRKDWPLIKPYVEQAILPSVSEEQIDEAHGGGEVQQQKGSGLELLFEDEGPEPSRT